MSGTEVLKKQLRLNSDALPPVPDLIPLENLNKDSLDVKNVEKSKRATRSPMEGRAARPWRHSAESRTADGIDSVATASSLHPFKTGSSKRHHRKFEHRMRKRGVSCDFELEHRVKEDPAPTNPRVNPIFLWVRQEDTKIVDVKCEDYDKRNRILLTKTAYGWRAIPRMESLTSTKVKTCTTPENAEDCCDRKTEKKKKRHRHKKAKSKAIGVQVEENYFNKTAEEDNEADEDDLLNVEKHIPTHTIHIVKSPLSSPTLQPTNTNEDAVDSSTNPTDAATLDYETKQTIYQTQNLSSPLDKLLAVAELELKSVVQERTQASQLSADQEFSVKSDEDNLQLSLLNIADDSVFTSDVAAKNCEKRSDFNVEDVPNVTEDNLSIEQLQEVLQDDKNDLNDSYLESFVMENQKNRQMQLSGINYNELQGDYCDYNEDDENTLVMDDILIRLEESLGNPEEIQQKLAESEIEDKENHETALDESDNSMEDVTETNNNDKIFVEQNSERILQETAIDVPEEADILGLVDISEEKFSVAEEQNKEEELLQHHEEKSHVAEEKHSIETTISDIELDNQPVNMTKIDDTDTTEIDPENKLASKIPLKEEDNQQIQPTDLSCSKRRISHTPPLCLDIKTNNMFGRNFQMESETIQSPEPSGIPAVTPDLMSVSSPACSEVTHCEEPLDLGKPRRKSESPSIVTCSEEVSLKRDAQKSLKTPKENVANNKNLQILEKNPFEQLEYILKHTKVRIPDPLLVPKDRLNVILTTPATEIPKLLYERPELKLPDALAFPHLLEDPDILVITIAQLQSILKKHFQTATKIEELTMKEASKDSKEATTVDCVTSSAKITTTQTVNEPKNAPKPHKVQKDAQKTAPKHPVEVSSKKNSAEAAAAPGGMAPQQNPFNQWLWMPYLYQLEAAAMAYDNKLNDLALKNAGSNPYNMPYAPHQAYQYPNFMGPPPHSPGFSYQQELLKLSNLQNLQNMQNLQQLGSEEHCSISSAAKKVKFNEGPMPKMPKTLSKADSNHSQAAINNKFNFLNSSNYYPMPQLSQNSSQNTAAEAFASYKHKTSSSRHFSHRNNANSTSKVNKNQLVQFNRVQNYMQHQLVVPNPKNPQPSATSSKSQTQRNRNEFAGPIPKGIDPRLFGLASQPIDLSNSSNCNFKNTAARGIMGASHKSNSRNCNILRNLIAKDDVPEVGSTTSGLEEALQSPKKLTTHHNMFHPQNCDTTHGQIGNLWHPLFGNQKNYANPWNFPSLSASHSK